MFRILGTGLVVFVLIACGDTGQEGTITDICSGELVGHVADDGTLVFDTGLRISPAEVEVLGASETFPASMTCVPELTSQASLKPLDTGTGTHLFHHVMIHHNGDECQMIYEQWCWNGDCSQRVVIQCNDGDAFVKNFV